MFGKGVCSVKKANKKAGHFRKNEKDDRKVLSYEELPLEEYEPKEKEKPKLDKRKMIIAVIVLMALILSIVLFYNIGRSPSCTGVMSNGGFDVKINGTNVSGGNFRNYAKGLCYVSDTGFVYLDEKGGEVYRSQLGYGETILRTCGDAAIVYDLGAKGFSIFSPSKNICSEQSNEKIYLADITSEYTYALVTETNGYNAKLTVYSPDNDKVYSYSFSEYYITSLALNRKGDKVAVCGVSAKNGTEVSAVYVLSTSEKEPVSKLEISSDIILDCEFLSDGSVCAIGSDAAYIANGSGFSKLSTKSYGGMNLSAYDMNTDMGLLMLSLSRSGDGRNCSIEVINSSADTEKTIETDLKITTLSSYKDRIAVCDADNIYFYRTSGELITSTDIPSDIVKVRLYSLNGAYLLGLDEIHDLVV